MVALPQPQPDDAVNKYERAREAREQSNTTIEAARLLLKWAKAEPDLFDAIMGDMPYQRCYDLVRMAVQDNRRNAWAPVVGQSRRTSGPKPDDASGLITMAQKTLMDYALSSGRRLGSMSKDGLMEEIALYGKQIKTMTLRQRWLKLIADQVQRGKTVEQCLSEAQLEALQRKALEG